MEDAEKEAFLKEFGRDYGYPNGPKTIDDIRATEFKRLQNGTVYLDHAGATLYSELQMEAVFKDLTTNIYGNPHSQSDSSLATHDFVREARQQVLDYCNASPKDYKCIFTSGATAALKFVGETFPWSHRSSFMYTMENHNSVLGIREYALSQGAAAVAIDINEDIHHAATCMKVSQHPIQRRNEAGVMEEEPIGNAYNLFAFPSECNFSGLRFNLGLVKNIKEDAERILQGSSYSKGHWMVLIDAAKGCATQPPNLSNYPADFVVISFYKLFGYPTGLGALVIRNDAAKLLKKTYFSGGTVAASIADIDFVKRREGIEEHFEDGTTAFLSIASILHGFKILHSLTVSAICRHTASLTVYVKKTLLALRHENGTGVCTLYGSHTSEASCHESGPIIAFNLKRSDGSWFGYREVEKLASLSGLHLRTGCFCNPGACAKFLGLSHLDLLANIEAGHICWDDIDMINGKPTGAVRVSFGYMSTYEDAKKFIDFIRHSFVSLPNTSRNGCLLRARSISFTSKGFERLTTSGYYLKSISIYPIKSCTGFSAESWPLGSAGLKYDREWILQSLAGEILTQKKVPEMIHINTFIDLNQGKLFVDSPRCKVKLHISLNSDSYHGERGEIDLHSQRYEVQGYENGVNVWFSNAIGRPCSLLRCLSSKNNFFLNEGRSKGMCRDVGSRLNFANEAQFLLISEESVSDLNNKLSSNVQNGSRGIHVQVNPMRFRPNLVISGGEPYSEDGWRNLKIGNQYFKSLGGCNRCQMINFAQQAGQVQKSNEPLATLASYRRLKGKILFGIMLTHEIGDKVGLDSNSWLQVGQEVHPNSEQR
ncbi:Aminotran_5 domain-containing protein/MOSC domain-containing protein/MOSC_N domain-containing protein [Cephalotus follicularis]|uniref:Molybdenum cofactor sulfurase n=1 Tax=Cephalotus follicularis TaxID=3775 RepID=A0A1Q3B7Z4_CEPFO|nr:Aminotran_5 domain-containing protein/MOSC domain-containing protein/MOSC_N domain-containing protein [Cephalotus follicularis]